MRWDYLPQDYTPDIGKAQISFEKRTDLNCFLKCLLADNSYWKRTFYRIGGRVDRYNENHYFHAYAATTLFDLQQTDEKTAHDISANKVMVYFEISTDPDVDTYSIKTVNDGNYILALTGISLHVYNTGVAILTINTENRKYSEIGQILEINEFGRRLYPQFLQPEYPHTQAARKAFLAESIEISILSAGHFEDDFSEYDDLDEREVHHYRGNIFERSWVVRVPAYIRRLFNSKFCFILKDEEGKTDCVRFNILTDDRMFFQSWYANEQFSERLKQVTDKEPFYDYLLNDNWHAYIFGDKKEPAIANKKMQKTLTETHTYARWAESGTLYGLTRDSFVCATGIHPLTHLLGIHMRTIYYQMAVLTLAQRASVLRFSGEISTLSDLARSNENKKLVTNIKILYKNYIEFINKIYYREITPYIQGMEIYKQFQDIMGIENDVKGLDGELNELFNYVNLEESEKQGREGHKLTIVATWFLPAGFLASLLALGWPTDPKTQGYWAAIFALGCLTSWLILKKKRK